MPVKKNTSGVGASRSKKIEAPVDIDTSMTQESCDCSSCACDCGECDTQKTSTYCHHMGRKLMMTFVGILLVYLIVFVGVLIRNEIKKFNYIGVADKSEHMITVDGQGKVSVTPDIARVTMGMQTQADTVKEAQITNDEKMTQFISSLKDLGIDSADIQTGQYSVYPMYDYTEADGRVLDGYEVSNTVNIKIRNQELVSQVLGLAGDIGLTIVQDVQMVIDEKSSYVEEARQLALEEVVKQARSLSSALGVNFVGVVSYDEYEGSGNGYDTYPKMAEMGYGGGSPVEAGSSDVILNVSVTFAIQ